LYAGDVTRVKPGYMRNFLFPNKIAVYATPENVKENSEKLSVCYNYN
jgi:ribosomal protein L9